MQFVYLTPGTVACTYYMLTQWYDSSENANSASKPSQQSMMCVCVHVHVCTAGLCIWLRRFVCVCMYVCICGRKIDLFSALPFKKILLSNHGI